MIETQGKHITEYREILRKVTSDKQKDLPWLLTFAVYKIQVLSATRAM